MTPKEKARELLENYIIIYNQTDWFYIHLAKKAAILVVNEVLNESPSRKYWDTYYDETPSAITFWQEVKEEIEKL